MSCSFDVYTAESTCFSIDSKGFYTAKIGLGLFPSGNVDRGDFVASYVGEKINEYEYLQRCLQGYGGYMVLLKKGVYLDCRSSALEGTCLASVINSPRKVYQYTNPLQWHNLIPVKARANCKIVVGQNSTDGLYADVYATQNIAPNVEFLISYSSSYTYPDLLTDEEELYSINSLRGFL